MKSNNPVVHPLYTVTSNQRAAHPQLKKNTRRHAATVFHKPLSDRSLTWWQEHQDTLLENRLILDSGCGKGQSSLLLAERFPNHTILAIDQSQNRLQKLSHHKPHNLIIAQTDCVEIWRLCAAHPCHIDKHYLLYPNPWPKKKHLQRRWHGHPCFSLLIQLSDHTHLRSNWACYIDECAKTCYQLGRHAQTYCISPYHPALTHFEAKYQAAGVPCYGLDII